MIRDSFLQLYSKVELFAEQLHGYQRIAYDFMWRVPFCAIFLDTGLGKTAAVLWYIRNLLFKEKANRILIIAPKRVANATWPDEIKIWHFSAGLRYNVIMSEAVTDFVNNAGHVARQRARMGGLSGELLKAEVEKARIVAAREAVRRQFKMNPYPIHIIHKEQVEFLVEAWGKEWPYDTIIIDESSAFKDHTTNRWKALWKIRRLKVVQRMVQMTATPCSESYLHLFAQVNLLDGGERFGKAYGKFAERYATQNRWTRKWTLREGAEQEIAAKIADICLIMKQEDYLDLDKPVFVQRKIHLPEKVFEKYLQMEKDQLVELDDGTSVVAETATAVHGKLLQMASGVLYEQRITLVDELEDEYREDRIVHHLHDEKLDDLEQLIEEIGEEPLLVVYYWKSSLDRILKRFPKAKVMDDDGKLIADWNKGKIPILLLHPMGCAHGLNLQKGGKYQYWFDLGNGSYEGYYQMWRRLARQGQKYTVTVFHAVAQRTLDVVLMHSYAEKRDAQDLMFELIKSKSLRAEIDRLSS